MNRQGTPNIKRFTVVSYLDVFHDQFSQEKHDFSVSDTGGSEEKNLRTPNTLLSMIQLIQTIDDAYSGDAY